MADNVKSLIAAGFEILEFHVLDSVGYASGATGTVASGATGAAAGRIKAVKTMDIQVSDPEAVNITGDDNFQGQFIFAPNQGPSFIIEMAINNLTNDAVFQSTTVEDLGNISLGVEQPADPSYPDITLLAVSRAKSKEVGTDGVSQYAGVIIPKTQIVPLGRSGFNERGEATYRYRVIASTSDADPWGKTYTNATNGTTGAVIRPWSAANRVTTHRFTGDAATLAFVLSQTPASTSLSDVIVFKDGLRMTTGVTVVVATKTVTFSVAPATGSKIVIFYEYTQ